VTIQTVFIVHKLRKIREVKAVIVVCDKWTWADVAGKRYLLGTSAFFTRKAAEVRKLGVLRKLAETRMPYYHPAARIADLAQMQLNEYKNHGTIN
jgi:hypothetical protein